MQARLSSRRSARAYGSASGIRPRPGAMTWQKVVRLFLHGRAAVGFDEARGRPDQFRDLWRQFVSRAAMQW